MVVPVKITSIVEHFSYQHCRHNTDQQGITWDRETSDNHSASSQDKLGGSNWFQPDLSSFRLEFPWQHVDEHCHEAILSMSLLLFYIQDAVFLVSIQNEVFIVSSLGKKTNQQNPYLIPEVDSYMIFCLEVVVLNFCFYGDFCHHFIKRCLNFAVVWETQILLLVTIWLKKIISIIFISSKKDWYAIHYPYMP